MDDRLWTEGVLVATSVLTVKITPLFRNFRKLSYLFRSTIFSFISGKTFSSEQSICSLKLLFGTLTWGHPKRKVLSPPPLEAISLQDRPLSAGHLIANGFIYFVLIVSLLGNIIVFITTSFLSLLDRLPRFQVVRFLIYHWSVWVSSTYSSFFLSLKIDLISSKRILDLKIQKVQSIREDQFINSVQVRRFS